MATVNQLLTDHFRCPDPGSDFVNLAAGEARTGYFLFGRDVVCYGRTTAQAVGQTVDEPAHDAADGQVEATRRLLSFDPAEMVENLRRERYVSVAPRGSIASHVQSLSRRLYYGVRPLLPVSVRKHIQRRFFSSRKKMPFPKWPVDRTVDRFLENLLATCMKAQGQKQIPFIWFWPDVCSSAAIMTHDVETSSGVRFCPTLMDLDAQFGIPASFQVVPEDRYPNPGPLLDEMRRRGFEINVHDLNHDGRLYSERQEFLRRVKRINAYGREFGAKGFRAGALYRNLDWYHELAFDYDMSVPNVGHLDPQPGGCCTVMPYFIGGMLELPVTTTQDYTLFHILSEYSMDLWIRQIELIRDGHGLVSVIAHPDCLQEKRAQQTYCHLLAYLAKLRSEAGVWIALPSEVNDWWRARSRMELVQERGAWHIEGPGKERARVAYARLTEDGVSYHFSDGQGCEQTSEPARPVVEGV